MRTAIGDRPPRRSSADRPADAVYTTVFAMGGAGGAVLLLASASLPGRPSLS